MESKYSVVKRVTPDHPDALRYMKAGGKITIKSNLTYDEAYSMIDEALDLKNQDLFQKGDLLFYKESVLLEINEL